MLLLAVMFLTEIADATTSIPTYQIQDPVSGATLTCNRCPPGYHMRAHCSATQQTQCEPCKELHFTQYWNYLSKCLYCNNFCVGENEYVKHECSPLNNRVCECVEGYYRHQEFCSKHTTCPPGHGVEQKGTAHSDTVCMKCSPGSYSSNNSAVEHCLSHTDCASLGLQTVVKGTVWHDNVCASCEDTKLRGGIDFLREILPDFFAVQRMKSKRALKLLRTLTSGNRLHENRGVRDTSKALQNVFSEWVKTASEEKLKKLPDLLRQLRLDNMADKLERKIRKVESAIYLCNIAT
ncbi:hypothetical protein AGOR_G00113400 [Albula goreensis]|uniref:TNFR-Cys domain-containing protein n=1 Tax=Albula goreensis TaxID=1534307 RepID=A0A8T3DDI2_9TELE|nr:hypothetical protein AGOR_G00113400 [Albula goreensis]